MIGNWDLNDEIRIAYGKMQNWKKDMKGFILILGFKDLKKWITGLISFMESNALHKCDGSK